MSAPGSADRIDGLCAWRAVLMIGGLFLHATMGDESLPAFAAINIASGAFRMGAFFAISGLLSGLALRRQTHAARWTRRRLVQIGVPTAFGIMVVCPVIGGMWRLAATHAHAPPPTMLNLYHLWFLVALLGYTPVAAVLHLADREGGVFERVEHRLGERRDPLTQAALLLLMGAVSFVLTILGLQFVNRCVAERYWPLLAELPLFMGYAPLYLLGFAAARAPGLRALLVTDVRAPLLIIGTVVIAHLLWRSPYLPPLSRGAKAWGDDMLLVGSAAWCPPAATALILRSSIRIRNVPMILQRLSDASFTIYILHYPIILATKLMIAPLLLGQWSTYAIAVLSGGLLSYWAHVALVTRSPTLSLLLNGRHECVPMRRAAPA